MNIDVTAVSSDGKTWSEKFEDVHAYSDGGVLFVDRDAPEGSDDRPYSSDMVTIASFSPGSWHSWRRID